MSIKTPIIPNLALKGIDAKIQEIQILMDSNLSWLVKSFGLADRIVDQKNDKPYIYPAVFESNVKDPIPLMPSDVWDSFAFWTKSGELRIDSEGSFVSKNPLITQEVSCIFYMDISKIDNVSTYKETKSKIIEDVFDFFNNVHVSAMLVPVKFIEDDITKVFDGFTLDQLDNKWKMYPKWTCRMDFELSYRDGCYSLNTYSHT
jgi:hypothetical protein